MANTIYKKLLNIQRDLKAPKGQYNNFGKYSYRNAEDIMEALKPLLVENNAITYVEDDTIEYIGQRYYLVATISFVDVETGEKITVKARAREEENKKGMDGSQITGAASSYARKYALSGLFLIDDNKDADSNEYHKQNNQQKPKQQGQQQQQGNQQTQEQQVRYIDNTQYQEINDLINDIAKIKGMPFDTLANYVLSEKLKGLQDFHRVQVGDYEVLKNYLTEQLAKAKAKRGN
ncbi:TPA: ERF family protein [Streptococcus pneumoniae]|uniref:Phage single-strand DNA binding protein n=2 Tax=Streptococcus pneumoniae TaxID=1313 RepID=A0AA87C5Z9_STREE|nr:ERF family protein [Streptococcus pneumoniae]MDV8222938.1 ERF family protein [Streptococcus pneumoniae]MDV8575878.1 ERF family protein [Streptococcus pneumoniae]MDV8897722.1 ERF family protein [Streptococcus pneumoniae]CGE69681.1 phage single-strand DNA binding protein [Streptococcus pneumoniae]CIP81330.1 phage single-strand DNA binding protein [Streptococcus pneumoniae]